ncbi:hypothetical protein L5M36_22280 [Shewanella sp. SM72]|uniref:hypothetical protein n=1 Tax=Shewanella sp. SM72 TaxID=2912805 RepID=UPI0021DA9C8E|nr:hypothetical protein [Shewanella sp. SM72]MCU8019582.1 hypothetical protein [Shewanella sp. SM72]
MQLLKLLGSKLKSDDVIELLEHLGIDVIYDFDRHHEGMEDVYWALFYEQGFQFRFNESQLLDVIFLYIIERDGFEPISKDLIETPIYASFTEAKNSFNSLGIEYTNSPDDDPNHMLYQRWIKSKHQGFTTHYEFTDEKLRMITMSLITK